VPKGIFAAHLTSPDVGPDHFGERASRRRGPGGTSIGDANRVAILRVERTGARELQMARRRRTV
jgi:hypothetical protein